MVPFGMEEGTELRIPGREFGLVVGEPAEFRFFTSAARKNDQPGDLIEDFGDELAGALAHGGAASRPARRLAKWCRCPSKPWSPKPACCSSGAWPATAAAGSWSSTCGSSVTAMKIGIDLGTTNSALAYIDEREAEDRDFPPVHIFETPQLVAAGRIEPRRTLPSFLFLEEGQPVGVYAREQGALVPTRLVHSAKSWLSNPDVDRTAKILPWDSQETGRVLSPVEVSARIHRQVPRGVGPRARARRWPSRTSSSPCRLRSTKRRAS